MIKNKDPSSFRDPSGYIYYENNEIFRAIDKSYAEHYEFLLSSGLYKKLESEKRLIPHQECIQSQNIYKVIQPELIKIISYPYEWSFTQLKDVALQLLKIQKISMDFGMTLKDATPFNFQFISNNPILIDTLSFERYTEGELWRPYQQFCELFLSPLLLARYVDPRILKITQTFMNGIPLDLTSKLLPFKTKFMLSTILNIHLHAKSQKKYSKQGKNHTKRKLPKRSLLGIINNLESIVKKISLSDEKSTWSNYYDDTNYTDSSFQEKQSIVRKCLNIVNPDVVLDIGSNTGIFAKIANEIATYVVACDNDHVAIDRLYKICKKEKNGILPLVLDITNPSSSIGWMNKERSDFFKRVNPDVVLALAIIHHLSISNNISFEKIAEFFADITVNLIIEFIPKSDSQVKFLLSTKADTFEHYTQKKFEENMCVYFRIKNCYQVGKSERMIYHFEKL